MDVLLLKHDYKKAASRLKGTYPAPTHVDQLILKDTILLAPSGSPTALFLKGSIAQEIWGPVYESWSEVDEELSNRGTAVGSILLPRLRADRSLGNRNVVPRAVLDVLAEDGVRQGILGYLDATADKPCHKTPLTSRNPEMLDRGEQLIRAVDQLYAQHLPNPYAKQRAEVEKASHWRLWSTVFTTIYIVTNFRSAYHPDYGNLLGVMSALVSMGAFRGGELVMARWRIAFALQPGDLLFFDPQQLHGNLPFNGKRLSAVLYCERRVADCGKR